MKGLTAGLLILILFISGCTSTVNTNPKNLASAVKLEANLAYVNDTTPKVIINITSNESIENATVIITLSEELTMENITWTGNITKNKPVIIETEINKNISGNFSIGATLESDSTEFAGTVTMLESVEISHSTSTSTEFTGNATAAESVEVTSSAVSNNTGESNNTNTSSSTQAGSSGSGGANWDACSVPRSYQACVVQSCFNVEEPRKGENFTSYFASLNTTDEYIYGMLQFDGCWGLPEDSWKAELSKDNFTLFTAMGDHTFFFKAPRNVLTTKSYDFIRWAGVVENQSMKIWPDLLTEIQNVNKTKILVIGYRGFTSEQHQRISEFSETVFYFGEHASVEINSTSVYDIAKLNFVKEIEKLYEITKE